MPPAARLARRAVSCLAGVPAAGALVALAFSAFALAAGTGHVDVPDQRRRQR
jgi:hypothetical protein